MAKAPSWKPGQSGNPKGRPPTPPLTSQAERDEAIARVGVAWKVLAELRERTETARKVLAETVLAAVEVHGASLRMIETGTSMSRTEVARRLDQAKKGYFDAHNH